MRAAEIVVTGDELVRGLTADTNAAFVASRLAANGIGVARITILPDDPDAIADAVRGAVDRGSALVVTTGGLGPAVDDRTLEAVAQAAGRPLATSDEALRRMAVRYAELARAGAVYDGELTPERRKMARLPRGSRPVENPVGTAPGVALDLDGCLVLCLPGVPRELEPMWDGPVTHLLRERFGTGGYAEETLYSTCSDESVLAPIASAVADRHPGVYVKTRAAGFEAADVMRMTLVSGGETDADAREALEAVVEDLRAALRDAGFDLLTRPPSEGG